MKTYQSSFLTALIYLFVFFMIACKKDNPTPVDTRTKFVGEWIGYSTITGICTDTTKRLASVEVYGPIRNADIKITNSDNNQVSFNGQTLGIVNDTILTLEPMSITGQFAPGEYATSNYSGFGCILKDSILSCSSAITEVHTVNGLNYTCTGFQKWNLKKK